MADLASATSALDSALTSAASAVSTAMPSLDPTSMASLVTSAAASMVTVSGLSNGVMATTTVPYLDPSSTVAPIPGVTPNVQKFGDHYYDVNTLTNNPYFSRMEQCFIGSCSLLLSYTRYFPAAGPTIFLLVLFGIGFLFHLPMGIYRKTWGYMIGLVFGCGLEVAGYVGRWGYRTNPFSQDNFLLNIICLTIGPAFLTASVYLCLARIIMAYGTGNARFAPRFYTTTFVAGDVMALVLQGAGGGIASTADPSSNGQKVGINIMIAGLVIQVVSLLFFILVSVDFAVGVARGRGARNPAFADLTRSLKFKAFLLALVFAVTTIFIRCCYRVAELSRGFESDFAQDEVLFSVLESGMIGAAVIALTVFHPGFVFGKRWAEANFSLRGRKPAALPQSSDSSGEKVKAGRIRTREV